MDAALSAALELAFFAVFGATLREYLQRGGTLERDICAVFGAVAGLFVLAALGTLSPGALRVATAIGVILLLAEPYLTLRLTAHFRPIDRTSRAVLLAFLGAVALYFAGGSPLSQPVTLILVGYFVVVELLAATFLTSEARRRTGLARSRLATAASATALFGGAILMLGLGSGAGSDMVTALNALARLVALLAALGYLAAFAPPAYFRRLAQRSAAFDFLRDLGIRADAAEASLLWLGLCETGRRVTGAPTAFVVLAGGAAAYETAAVAGAPLSEAALRLLDEAATDRLVANARSPKWRELARASGATEALVVPIARATGVDGALVCLLTGSPLFADDDAALLGIFAEWTAAAVERGHLLSELRRANDELAHASAAKSDFLASMSHELRTPLQAVLGFSDLLVEGHDGPLEESVVSDYAGYIHRAGVHLLGLINDVLDLSKVEAGRLDLQYEHVELGALVRQTAQSMRPLADARHIDLRTEEVGSVGLTADPARLRQIAFNLISNALKFTPDAGRVDISVTENRDTGHVELVVADTGPGIAPEEHDSIFEPFRQGAAGVGKKEGTGLGLSLTRRLVELHGGHLELESALGAGSRFTVRLPTAISVPSEPAWATADARPATERARESEALAVLVVEDDPTSARLLELYLADAGYRVALAASGEEGLRIAETMRPSAILLDLLLPGMDGWQVLSRLKSNEVTRSIPVLIVSVVDDAQLGLALGAVDYLVKPVSREVVLGALERMGVRRKQVQGGPVVLAIDDDPAALDLYDAAMRSGGLTMARADGGVVGLELARELRPRAILLDLLMPDLDGFEVLARLKADALTADIPVIVVTAHELDPADKSCLNGSVLAILDKGSDAMAALRGWVAAATTSGAGQNL